MSDENSERRKADESFRIRIIEQLAETKAILSQVRDSLKDMEQKLSAHGLKILEIQQAMWGGPGIGDIGLLEQHRRTVRNWAIFTWVGVFLLTLVGHIIAPLYNKAVADWAFNSVSERWVREHNRPKVTHYHIRVSRPPPEPAPPAEGDTN